jgi:hypothetical protein
MNMVCIFLEYLAVARGERNMDDSQTLIDFVRWARDNYEAKHYYLAIDDHGRGTSCIAWDETIGQDECITMPGLSQALQGATLNGDEPLDVVHYNACLMGMLENAYEIQDYADYVVLFPAGTWRI